MLILDHPGDLASAGGVALAIYLGAVPTALAYVLFARGLRHLPAGEVATLALAEPLTAAALGALVLGERPGVLALVGVALVLAGLAALAAPRRVHAPTGARPVMSPAAPLARTTTVDSLADALRARILAGELEPGAPLREQHVSADYRVARHIRAALRALAGEGLVQIETHRGARVTELVPRT